MCRFNFSKDRNLLSGTSSGSTAPGTVSLIKILSNIHSGCIYYSSCFHHTFTVFSAGVPGPLAKMEAINHRLDTLYYHQAAPRSDPSQRISMKDHLNTLIINKPPHTPGSGAGGDIPAEKHLRASRAGLSPQVYPRQKKRNSFCLLPDKRNTDAF